MNSNIMTNNKNWHVALACVWAFIAIICVVITRTISLPGLECAVVSFIFTGACVLCLRSTLDAIDPGWVEEEDCDELTGASTIAE